MKKLYLLLVCMICFVHTAYAQTIIDPVTGMVIYSGSSMYYVPVLPPPPQMPTANDFKRAGENAVRNSSKTTSSSVSTTRNTTRNATRTRVGSNHNDNPCPVCGGNGKCTSMTHPTAPDYCHGSGICKSCSGKGYVTSPYTGIGTTMKCTYCWSGKVGKCGRCRGTGKCSSCNGTGKLR